MCIGRTESNTRVRLDSQNLDSGRHSATFIANSSLDLNSATKYASMDTPLASYYTDIISLPRRTWISSTMFLPPRTFTSELLLGVGSPVFPKEDETVEMVDKPPGLYASVTTKRLPSLSSGWHLFLCSF